MAKSIQLRLNDDAFHKAVVAKGLLQANTWNDMFIELVDHILECKWGLHYP